jgi:hypothetical protein
MLGFDSNESRMHYALTEAKASLQLLDEANSITTEKMAWVFFLTSIDALRQAISDTCKSSSKLNPWYSTFANEIKTDPLLSYMRNARNNIQHLVTKTPMDNPLGMNLRDKNGKQFPVDSITSNFKDGVFTINIVAKDMPEDIELEVENYRLNARALAAMNMGVEYPVPKLHKGAPLDSDEIHYLAALTLGYYDNAVNDLKVIIESNG